MRPVNKKTHSGRDYMPNHTVLLQMSAIYVTKYGFKLTVLRSEFLGPEDKQRVPL